MLSNYVTDCFKRGVNKKKMQVIENLSFSQALEYLKQGHRISRQGWNGKEQYLVLAENIQVTIKGKETITATNKDIGSKAILFCGTRGHQVGWLASQGDLLGNDWIAKLD